MVSNVKDENQVVAHQGPSQVIKKALDIALLLPKNSVPV
jgi:hypothetical protein